MTWWCVARGEPWSWAWQPYPGVWLFVALFATLYWTQAHAPGGRALANVTADVSFPRARRLSAITGLVLLWLTLDWPVAALGAGYLSGVHALQFVMLAMIIPTLLLLGVSARALAMLQSSPRTLALLGTLTGPAFAAAFFTLVMIATHAPPILDVLMKSQWGNFVLDMLWLTSGICLAWPIVCKVPERPRFIPPLQILYLFLGTVAHVFIGMWLLSAEFPVYATYELAPRVSALSALYDQHMAGAVMILLGSSTLLAAITIIFFRWQGTGAGGERLADGFGADSG